jgi:hypothetical protein
VPAGGLLLSGKVYWTQAEYQRAVAARVARRARLMEYLAAEGLLSEEDGS